MCLTHFSSAHYDSVSTALGATDDAIGVVSLIAMVEYLSTKVRTKRTAIFNINDGEEDGLHGAHLYDATSLCTSLPAHCYLQAPGTSLVKNPRHFH